MPNHFVFDEIFWQEEEDELRNTLLAIAIAASLYGAEVGIAQLLDAGVSFTDINRATSLIEQRASDFINLMVGGLIETNRANVSKIIDLWRSSGAPVPELVKTLIRMGENASRLISTTEVTRLFSLGQRTVWEMSGVVTARRWYTQEDERVCRICKTLHGTVVPLDVSFTRLDTNDGREMVTANETAGTYLTNAGYELNPYGDPPAHAGCRCFMLPIVVNFGLVKPSIRVLEMYNAFCCEVAA